MTDDQQARALLNLAADLPDGVRPPVTRLVERGRARRSRRAALSVIIVATAVVVAVSLPFALRAGHSGRPGTSLPLGGRRVPPGLFGSLPATAGGGPGASAAQIARYRWSVLPASPLGPRSYPVLTWTGRELLEIGGVGPGGRHSHAGAAYSPATRTWRSIAPAPKALGLGSAVATWTGRELFATGGSVPSRSPQGLGPPAGLYDPAANRWTLTTLPRQLAGLTQVAVTWTGRVVVVAGILPGHAVGVAAYDPARGRWQVITPALPAGHLALGVAVLALPGRLILWSLWSRNHRISATAEALYSGVDLLALDASGRWANVTGRWPQHQVVSEPAFTGDAILVPPGQIWCGMCSHPYSASSGFLADPVSLRRTTIPPGPLGEAEPAFVWTGRAILAVDLDATASGPRGVTFRPGDLAIYDIQAGRWRRAPAAPGHPAPAATPLWTGTQLLELSGNGQLLALHR